MALKVGGIDLDRKILADMAVHDAEGFTALVASAKQHMPKPRQHKRTQPTTASYGTIEKDDRAGPVRNSALLAPTDAA